MISVTQLRSGATFEENGQPFIVLKYEHTKMGRGNANIKVRIKNLETGSVVERNFTSGAKVEEIVTVKKKMQYLYDDEQNYYFMNTQTFEQMEIEKDIIGEDGAFLAEGTIVDVLFWEEKPLKIDVPSKMEFTIVETGPGVKGDSATNIYKPAILNNGLTVSVPLFINEGEKIVIDTKTKSYVERVK